MDNPEFIDSLVSIFLEIWSIFTRWDIPFIGISPAFLIGALMMLSIVSFVLRNILGMIGGVPFSGPSVVSEGARRIEASDDYKRAYAAYRHRRLQKQKKWLL